jgi:hypothetical protein
MAIFDRVLYTCKKFIIRCPKTYVIFVTIRYESACGPVAVLVFKTGERGDELRWWVRLPRALASAYHVTFGAW